MLGLGEGDSTERASKVDTGPRWVCPCAGAPGLPTRVGQRQAASGEAELAEPIELPRCSGVHVVEWLERVDLRCHLRPKCARVEAVDPFDRRATLSHTRPESVAPDPASGDQPDAGDPDVAEIVGHIPGFVGGGLADSPPGFPADSAPLSMTGSIARASAMDLNVASVRPAMGRTKSRITRRAYALALRSKTCSIETLHPPAAGSIRQVTLMPSVAPPWWTNRSRRAPGSFDVRARQATGMPTPRGRKRGRRATNSTVLLPSVCRSRTCARR